MKFDKDEADRRYNICKECEFFIKKTRQCNICKCFMPIKTKISITKCPKNKWGTVENSWI